ncbi:glutamine--fructose-6-phosphate transaminase (isomerizing) [Phototrophicus methaneseepsis]|uniref:Glutamine--fructose-6-phosphate aminotransferase [isomerizing] n=1 Tax=Phototrophicus methaneseepsis TaxID=2710758 RepID=A0A7S8E5E2_9CHLR|nr:glutamine--fructose-6-phosphate transaminase (isomerizing) [Phototrophicus methaneseepsis]QPC80675.1 glutamine--fructose-6-phosphate transaminase (isomerizing) [Phototrophicus methaneseepsis]
MCGIVGYIGPKDATSIILDGLQRLEYRGYDSAGVAVLEAGTIAVRRDVGKLFRLRNRVQNDPISGHIGIGHTRWATHGVPAEHNAHPHISMNCEFVVVHNGIVENYLELRQELQAKRFQFASETDTEVIVQLVQYYASQGIRDIAEATRRATSRLRGAHAIVVMSKHQPDRLVAVRIGNAGGVAIGLGQDEMYIASDIPAILEHTRQMIFLESRQMAVITRSAYQIQTLDCEPIEAEIHDIPYDPISAVKGEYKHFMQKEIYEQPRAITDTIRGRVDFDNMQIVLPELNITAEQIRQLDQIVTVACGTSYYSGLVGKFFIEKLARLRVEVAYGSEYRYSDPILDERTAILAITQSGETVDTLAAIEEAREKHATIWSIVNAIGSQAMRVADGYIAMHAGPEIGVASTKAFVTSIVDQYLLALYLAQARGTLSQDQLRQAIHDVSRLPDLIGRTLEMDAAVQELAQALYQYTDFLYLGRGINYPIALEGALKLKEISYIHAEGYPAGEMKHGPIALIDESMPVLAIALKDDLYEKMISQIEQAQARGGIVIALATQGDSFIAQKADHVLYVPETPYLLSPVVNVVPLQLLAYHIAALRGADVDQPRNLAKSVTVE